MGVGQERTRRNTMGPSPAYAHKENLHRQLGASELEFTAWAAPRNPARLTVVIRSPAAPDRPVSKLTVNQTLIQVEANEKWLNRTCSC